MRKDIVTVAYQVYDRYKNNQLNDQFQNFQKSTLKEENISTRGKKCTVTLEREGNIVRKST